MRRSIILRKGSSVIAERLAEKGYHFKSDIPIRILKQAGLPVITKCNCCKQRITVVNAFVDTGRNTYYCPECAEYIADLLEF